MPNHRNGSIWGTGPTLWTTATHRYAVIINRDWSVHAWRQTKATGVWESFNLANVSGNPMSLPMDSTAQADEHYRMAICRDGSGIIHVTGNMHGDPHRYVVCTDEDDWTNPASWEDGNPRLPDLTLTGGLLFMSYGIFRPAPDGSVVLMFHQQEDHPVNDVNGRDTLVFVMGPSASNWVEFAPGTNGELMVVPEDEDEETTPGRSYTASFLFGPDGTFHLFMLWQMETLNAQTRSDLSYIRRTPAGVWETITGDPVTMPIDYPQVLSADDCLIPDQLPWINQNWQMALDADGNPHINVQQTAGSRRRHWWDGSAWQYVDLNSFEYGHLMNIRGELWNQRSALSRQIQLHGPNGELVPLSGRVTNNFEPQPCPVRVLFDGVYEVLAPDGDTPRVYTFGDGPRLRAAA